MTKMIDTRINDTWSLLLPEHRARRPEWVTGWEPERLNAMWARIKLLKKTKDTAPIVVDVGAEEGDMPALFAKWGAQVYLIEPNLKVWSNIRAIWEANKLKPLGYFAGFAGTETKTFPEYTEKVAPKKGWPLCAYDDIQVEHGFDRLAESAHWINQMQLDDLSFMPDLITIDVEGSEFEVLKGAKRILTEGSPDVFISVHPEFLFHNHNEYEAHLHKFMRDLGYTGTWLAYDHEHHWHYRKVAK